MHLIFLFIFVAVQNSMKVMFKCLWKNCEKILSTSSGIQRHIRTIHLGYVSIRVRVTQTVDWRAERGGVCKLLQQHKPLKYTSEDTFLWIGLYTGSSLNCVISYVVGLHANNNFFQVCLLNLHEQAFLSLWAV